MIRSLFAATAALLCTVAHADVVYTWQQVSGSSSIESSAGRLVLADFAVTGGPYDYQRSDWNPPAANSTGPSPVLSIFFSVSNPSGAGYGWGFGVPSGMGANASLTVQGLQESPSGLLGRISAFDSRPQSLTLASNAAGLWTVVDATTDGTRPCLGVNSPTFNGPTSYNCTGATGRWIREGTVPEPGSMALLGLGMLGAAASLRKRKA